MTKPKDGPQLDETVELVDEPKEDLYATVAMGVDEATAAARSPATPFAKGSGEGSQPPRGQSAIPGAPWSADARSADAEAVQQPDSTIDETMRLKPVSVDPPVPLDQTVALSAEPSADPAEPAAEPAPVPEEKAPTEKVEPRWREDPEAPLELGSSEPERPPLPAIAQQRVDLSGFYDRFKKRS